jgi:putative endonuclease
MGWWMQAKITALEKSASALESLARRRGRWPTEPPHLATGLEGEKVGFFYLMRNGYTVVARRWSSNRVRGDLDLVAWQGKTLCIVEVKTRTAHDIVPAELAVDSKKRAVLRRLTRQYIRRIPGNEVPHVRFDILSVYLVPGREKEVFHFKDAFDWSEGRREWD